MMRNRDMLLKELMELDFTIVDLSLFLDTHPTCTQAIAEYNLAVAKKVAATKHFEGLYGPIELEQTPEMKNHWQWVESPWPWQYTDNMKVNEEVKLHVEL